MSKFQGILFTLKKRKQYPDKPDKKFYDFTTFGYYDGLLVSYIDQWYQFRPARIASICGYVSQGAPFTDIYVIKGFFPNNECTDDDLFDYSIWRKIGEKGSKDGMCKETVTLLKTHPYICLSSVHLSQTFVEQYDDPEKMTNEVKKYIKDTAKREAWNLQELHCAVFPIIGFSDYVIGFVSEDFEIPTYCISKLREWKIKDKAVISSCYTICGVYKDFQVTKENFNANSGARLIAEFSLREGTSAKEFHTIIRQKLMEKLEKLQIEEKWRQKVEDELKDYYITFGNVDTLVMPNINIESYLVLFMAQEFQPGDLFYKNYIIGTKTGICIAEKVKQKHASKLYGSNDRKCIEPDIYGINTKWKKFSEDLEQELRKRNYTVRMSRAIEQIIQNYYNIANTRHGFDIRYCLDDFISATLGCIRTCWEDEEADWDKIKSAVRVFRDRVGDFIADLLRSDKPFIEGNTLLHPAIGTATKILFAYTAILNKVAMQMGDNDQQIVFLVVSGGADATTAIDLFSFLAAEKISKNSKEEEKIKKPVLIVVPEKGLYDVKGTFFRLVHECMHYCGKRLRAERYDLYLDIMAEIMSRDIVTPLINEKFIEEYLSSQKMYLPQEQYRLVYDKVCGQTEKWGEEFRNQIKKCICEYADFIEYRRNQKDESDYYEDVLFQSYSAKKHCAGILSADSIASIWNREVDSLSGKIENTISDMEDELYEKINEILQKEGANVYAPDIRARRLAYQKQKGEDRRFRKYLSIYGAVLTDDYNVGMWKRFKAWYNYDAISKSAFWSMRESRADFLAIRLLGMRVEEYLLAFIYEEEDIGRAMPMTLDNVLRMGSVLKIGFQISSKNIEQNIRESILDYARRMKDNAGYEYEDKPNRMEDYLNEYVDRIKSLLEKYEAERWKCVAEKVERYLLDIENILVEDKSMGQLRKTYMEWDMTDGDNAYAVIRYLFQQWEGLAKGDKNESGGCAD